MTTIQKQATSPIAHLTEADIEQIGIELDAIRQDVLDSRGADDAAYIRKLIDTQRKLELGSRAVLLFSIFPPAWLLGTAGLSVAKILDNMEIGHNILHGQWDWMRDPKIHSSTWEWDMASPSEQWKHSHNELHHTYTNVIGKDNDLGYGIMRVDEEQRWSPFHLGQPVWCFINAVFFEYGIAAYDLDLGAVIKKKQTERPRVPSSRQERADQDPQAGHQGLRRAPGPVDPDRLVPADPGGQLHRQHRAQPVVQLDHPVRPLPRGRRDLREALDRGRDPRRLVCPADARLGQHLRFQGAAPDERQPVAPDRAPPLPGPAVQPLRGDRSQGAGAVRQVRAELPRSSARAAGLLGLAQGRAALAAQRLARHDQRRRTCPASSRCSTPCPPRARRSVAPPRPG